MLNSDFKMKALKNKVFIVGDVHGCFNSLTQLLKKADCDPDKHRLILLGDLINKGPHSFKVLNWVRRNKIESLMGNHEWKFIKCVEQKSPLPKPLKELKGQMGKELSQWIKWLKTLPLYIEEEDFLAVHGGLVPGEEPKQSSPENLLNIRYWDDKNKCLKKTGAPPWHHFYKKQKLVVYGHWALQGLNIQSNSIGLDTGCVYGGKLTGLWLPKRSIVQV